MSWCVAACIHGYLLTSQSQIRCWVKGFQSLENTEWFWCAWAQTIPLTLTFSFLNSESVCVLSFTSKAPPRTPAHLSFFLCSLWFRYMALSTVTKLQSPKRMKVFCCNIANISFNNVRNISMGLQRKIHDSGLKIAAMSAPAKLTWTWQECVWSHNLLSVTYKVSDHHLHHEQQGWAAMTPHWLHQPQMMGVNEYKRIHSKFWANKCF